MREWTSTPEIGRLAQLAKEPLERHRHAHVFAAVSGGADSTAMLLALLALRKDSWLTGSLTVLHLDHAVRAQESAADARFVASLARHFDIDLQAHRLDGRPQTERSPSEDTLRNARYAVFHRALAGAGTAAVVATGHHAEDNLETVLFRLRRGTGLRGLAGIPADREVRGLKGARMVRPVLTASKRQLLAACRSLGITPTEDHTNRDTDRARNWIRHEVVPRLRTREPDLDRLIGHMSDLATELTTSLDRRTQTWIAERRQVLSPETILLRTELSDSPQVQSAAIRALRIEWLPQASDPSRAWCRRVLDLAAGPVGRRVAGRGDPITIERTRAGLLWTFCPPVASVPCAMHTLRPAAAPHPSSLLHDPT